jgi:YihY family inner membrane protein
MPKRSFGELMGRLTSAARRLRRDIFEADDIDVISNFHRLGVDFARFMIVLWRETAGNQIWQRASALTYTTILSIFPLLMVLSSAASIFYTEEEEERLIGWVTQQFTPQSPNVLEELIGNNTGGKDQEALPQDAAVPVEQIDPPDGEAPTGQGDPEGDGAGEDEAAEPLPAAEDFAAAIQEWGGDYRNAAGGLGFAGLLGLFITSLLLYKSIEQAFQAAWETSHISSLKRTITGFTFLVVIAPIILGLSITISSFVVGIISGGSNDSAQTVVVQAENGQATTTTVTAPADPPSGLRRYMLMLVPAVFNSLILAAAYMFIPQAKVEWHFALLGGFIAGFLWEAAKLSFFAYLYMSTVQRAMIQSLGALPIFLIWIYFTWLVFLVGNQIVYVAQNFTRLRLHHFGPQSRTYLDGRLLVAITLLIADAFERGKGGIRYEELGMMLRVPPREFDRAMGILLRHHVIAMTEDGRYTMRQPPDRICIDTLLNLGCDPIAVCARRGLVEYPAVGLALEGIQDEILGVGRKRTLRDILAVRRESLSEASNKAGET